MLSLIILSKISQFFLQQVVNLRFKKPQNTHENVRLYSFDGHNSFNCTSILACSSKAFQGDEHVSIGTNGSVGILVEEKPLWHFQYPEASWLQQFHLIMFMMFKKNSI